MKTNLEIKYWQYQFIVLVYGILFLSILFLFLMYLKTNQVNEITCYDLKSFNETLKIIDKNCHSTFITKQYGSEDWKVFVGNVCDGIKCENKYYDIKNCIEGKELGK